MAVEEAGGSVEGVAGVAADRVESFAAALQVAKSRPAIYLQTGELKAIKRHLYTSHARIEGHGDTYTP